MTADSIFIQFKDFQYNLKAEEISNFELAENCINFNYVLTSIKKKEYSYLRINLNEILYYSLCGIEK